MKQILSDPLFFGEECLNQMHLFIGAWFDALMIAVTTLGDPMFYVLVLPLCYWLYNKEVTLKIGFLFLLSAAINDISKEIYRNPRPNPANLLDGIRELNLSFKPHSPGFPSGHTQGAVTFWGGVIYFMRNRWLTLFSVLMIILIPYSRVYLGVHFLGDVVGGYILGLLCMLMLIPLIKFVTDNYAKAKDLWIVLLLIIAPLLLFIITADMGTYQTLGVLSGMFLGAFLAKERVEFNPRNTIVPNLLKILIGFTGIIIFKEGFKLILPSISICDYFRYWLIGFWVTLGAPFVFNKIPMLREKISS